MTECLPCSLEQAEQSQIVLRDDDWACEVARGSEVPGWYILRLRRHAEGWTGPRPDELAGFGPFAQRVATAMQQATGAPTTYFMSYGENHPHFHFLVIARPTDLDPENRGPNVLSLRDELKDWDAALSVAAEVRAALDGSDRPPLDTSATS